MESSFELTVECAFCEALLSLKVNTVIGAATRLPRCPACNQLLLLEYEVLLIEKGPGG